MVVRNENIRVTGKDTVLLPTPRELKQEYPLPESVIDSVISHRNRIQDILKGIIDGFIVVMGPCAFRSYDETLEYAQWFSRMMKKYPRLCMVLRLCMDKPRSDLGWPGFLEDPHMDESCDMVFGINETRRIFVDVAKLGVPIAMESYGTRTIHKVSDCVAYDWVGARTVTDGNHRKMAKGLSMPIGFKNAEDGNIMAAIRAVKTAIHSGYFIGDDDDGRECRLHGMGNEYAHIILRGGTSPDGKRMPNYDEASVRYALDMLKKNGFMEALLIDTNHANSGKKPERQKEIALGAAGYRLAGLTGVKGIVVESDLLDGAHEKFPVPATNRTYGLSVTDPCLGLAGSEDLLEALAQKLALK